MEHSNSSKFSAVCRDDERRSMVLAVVAQLAVFPNAFNASAALRSRVIDVIEKASKSLSGLVCAHVADKTSAALSVFGSQPVAFGAIVRRPRRASASDCWQQ